MRRTGWAVLVMAVAVVGGSLLVRGPASGAFAGSIAGVVVDVVDGDTIDVGGVGRVRIIGIDTPERDECGFETATRRLAELVLGERVVLVAGASGDVDRYGRLLRYVDVDGVDAGLVLIEEGWAVPRYDSRDGYGAHQREAGYIQAESGVVGRSGSAGYSCRSP